MISNGFDESPAVGEKKGDAALIRFTCPSLAFELGHGLAAVSSGGLCVIEELGSVEIGIGSDTHCGGSVLDY